MSLELTVEGREAQLDVRRFAVHEALSSLYRVSVWARSESANVDLAGLVGQAARFGFASPVPHALEPSRVWSGVCTRATQIGVEPDGLSSYLIEIAPLLWLATQRTDMRIFQHLSVPEIADRVLAVYEIEPDWQIDRTRYPKLEVRVQYEETDYAFFSRLCEEAGITFLFEDDPRGSRLILSDAPERRDRRQAVLPFHTSAGGAMNAEHVFDARIARELRPSRALSLDYDPRSAKSLRAAEAARGAEPNGEVVRYQPGSFTAEGERSGATPVADERGASRAVESRGRDHAAAALSTARDEAHVLHLQTNAFDLKPGRVLEVARHGHADAEVPVLTISGHIEGAVDSPWRAAVRAVPAGESYRPPLRTPRPLVHGVQVATVVGPASNARSDTGEATRQGDVEALHVDELGRVRVRFPWDREGASDGLTSCWLRVSQGWAGRHYGTLHLPRVGHEVLVTFLDGDPDQPVISGRLHDAVETAPERLPADRTVSGVSSRSVGTGASRAEARAGSNHIRFDDRAGSEQWDLWAERDMRVLVKHDETHTTLNNREKTVSGDEIDTTGAQRIEVTELDRAESTDGSRVASTGEHRETKVRGNAGARVEQNRQVLLRGQTHSVVRGDRRSITDGDAHETTRGGRREAVDKTHSSTVLDDHLTRVAGTFASESGRTTSYHADSMLVAEAQRASVRGPGGFISMDEAGVTIVGTLVRINAGGTAGSSLEAHPIQPSEARELARPAMPDGAAGSTGAGGLQALAAVRTPDAAQAPEKLGKLGDLPVLQSNDLVFGGVKDKLGRSAMDRMRAGLPPLAANGLPVALRRGATAQAAPLLTETAPLLPTGLAGLMAKRADGGLDSGGAERAAYWRERASAGGAGT